MATEEKAACREVSQRLNAAKSVVAFTGAGISAESGIATFRGSGGLWGKYPIEQVATPEGFVADPQLVWNFYLERRKGVLAAKPNAAHLSIAEWEKRIPFVGVVTQNIDGLHREAGSSNIQELHGNIWKVRCTQCDTLQDDQALERKSLPECAKCGGLIRPHIVWFGEPLDGRVVQDSIEWMRRADLIFVIGTSGVVEPAASFVRDAKYHGAFLVEVNIERTQLSRFMDISIFGKSCEVLGEWLEIR